MKQRLLFTLPPECRPKYWTGFPIDPDDARQGYIKVTQDGEIIFVTPEDEPGNSLL
jgi:hypothetical protein